MEHLEQTLAEQLKITNHEIGKRKQLLGLTESDALVLKKYKPLFTKYLDGIVKNFYDKQVSFPEIALVIGDAETLRRLKSAMKRYILDIFDGVFDLEYVNRRLRIGKVHQRIGVSPKLYIAAITQLEEELQNTLLMHQFSDDEISDEVVIKKAVNKVLMLDTQLVFDTYISSLISEVESTKAELKQYADSLEKVVEKRTAQLEELSTKDMLTNLFNQRAFYDHLRRELSASERYQESLSLCYLDLNRFKKLNDQHGHKEGDKVLSLVGKCMLQVLRDTDIPCRYGGDEFVVIFPRTNMQGAKMVIERVVEQFKKENKTRVNFSIGISETGPVDFVDVDTLIQDADKKMYKSKAKSKKRAGFYITC